MLGPRVLGSRFSVVVGMELPLHGPRWRLSPQASQLHSGSGERRG